MAAPDPLIQAETAGCIRILLPPAASLIAALDPGVDEHTLAHVLARAHQLNGVFGPDAFQGKPRAAVLFHMALRGLTTADRNSHERSAVSLRREAAATLLLGLQAAREEAGEVTP